jgi:hypothetical protein
VLPIRISEEVTPGDSAARATYGAAGMNGTAANPVNSERRRNMAYLPERFFVDPRH